MNRNFPVLVGAIVAAAVLTGCGGPQKDATYENATKLREAVIASGVDCPGDAPDPSKDGTEDFIKCSSDMGLHVFTTDSEMSLGKTLMSFTKTTSLQGPRWIVEAHDASVLAKIKDKLGGSLVVP
ncbi:hypothetical protein ABH924_000139 [Arthrobacter sp. GAS37]|uniref:hypothetical protein n=1 Tax=Arthrobacter sp. GAS37 TaxID=3156261 RepID=UPI003836383C